ncbi:MAG: 50S ribosomal protein L21 [Cyanobium sp. MAG06]|nr:50S ribosomal protein L21 [Cyanobium sp. MAG06]
MNYSVIKTGGKQYIAEAGKKLKIEIIKGDFKIGDKVVFDNVLFTCKDGKYTIGTPMVAGATVEAKIVDINREAKIRVVKYRAKSRYHKVYGHRQHKFVVEII